MEISIAAEKLFSIGDLVITNTLFTSFIVVGLILLLFIYLRLNFSYVKPSKLQLTFEMLIGGLYGLAHDILGTKYVKQLFTFLFTFFIFVLISNWFGLLPFVPTTVIQAEPKQTSETQADVSLSNCIKTKECYLTSSGVQEFGKATHVFRPPTSDLSLTIALALISVVITNILGFKSLGLAYFKKYINFSNPINTFVGILEIVSEIGKIVSFSFRLFGNVFAGEILLTVITFISMGLATLPFFALEVFVSLIQALVFFMLTAVFINLAVSHSEH